MENTGIDRSTLADIVRRVLGALDLARRDGFLNVLRYIVRNAGRRT